MYWCASAFEGGSVIARISSDGPGYSSAPVFSVLYMESNSTYGMALRKAVAYLAREGLIEVCVNANGVEHWDYILGN